MLKNLAIAASLIAGAATLGWHGDTIIDATQERLSVEVAAVIDYFTYDPRVATLECVRTLSKSESCVRHVDAWIAVDGREAVMREVVPLMFKSLASQVDDPVASLMMHGLGNALESAK